MTKQTITHNITIVLIDGSSKSVTDADAALVALEAFKQKNVVKIPEDDCTLYIPYRSILTFKDCATVTTEEVEDSTCVEG